MLWMGFPLFHIVGKGPVLDIGWHADPPELLSRILPLPKRWKQRFFLESRQNLAPSSKRPLPAFAINRRATTRNPPMTSIASAIFLAHALSVFLMTAVIWFVQLVTYPQFIEIGESRFRDYHASYARKISMIVIPLMLVELGSAMAAVPVFWNHEWKIWMTVGAALTLLTWIITFTVQVPQHSILGNGYSRTTIKALVKGNWIRTFLWSAHSLILLKLVWTQLR